MLKEGNFTRNYFCITLLVYAIGGFTQSVQENKPFIHV